MRLSWKAKVMILLRVLAIAASKTLFYEGRVAETLCFTRPFYYVFLRVGITKYYKLQAKLTTGSATGATKEP